MVVVDADVVSELGGWREVVSGGPAMMVMAGASLVSACDGVGNAISAVVVSVK